LSGTNIWSTFLEIGPYETCLFAQKHAQPFEKQNNWELKTKSGGLVYFFTMIPTLQNSTWTSTFVNFGAHHLCMISLYFFPSPLVCIWTLWRLPTPHGTFYFFSSLTTSIQIILHGPNYRGLQLWTAFD
jgi:hypothetical protein